MNSNDLKTKASPTTKRPVISVSAGARLEDALALMTTNGIHHLPVLENDRVVGLLLERDVLTAFITARSVDSSNRLNVETQENSPVAHVTTRESVTFSSTSEARADLLTVDRYMRHGVPCIDESTDLRDTLRLMLENHLSALPVVHDGKLVAIVTESDLLKLLDRLLRQQEEHGASALMASGENLLARPLVQNIMQTLGLMGI